MLMYPPEWRRRYGAELQCLLEDSSRPGAASGVRDIFDILKGGLMMRYTGTNVMRMALTWGLSCGLLGFLFAGLSAVRTPDRYEASATIAGRGRGAEGQITSQPASAEQMNALAQRGMSDKALSWIIENYNIHRYRWGPLGLGTHPYPDMAARIAGMRQDLRIDCRSGGILVLSYGGRVPALVTQVANQTASTIVEANLQARGDPPTPDWVQLTIVSPAQIPGHPESPKRKLMVAHGVAVGVLAGIAIALLRRRPMQLAS